MGRENREQRQSISPTDAAHEELERDRPAVDAQKSYHTVLEQHVQQAQEELERPAGGLALSGFSAGLDLGFGPLLMAVIATLGREELPRSVLELLLANAYAVGFIFVVLGRSALFTEQTTSAVLPVLTRRAGVAQLLRLWSIVLVANLVGTAVIGLVIASLGPAMGIVDRAVLGEIARKLLELPGWTMFFSAVVAGWLMGLLAWLVVASRSTGGQIVAVWLTTAAIGLGGFHHSIAGSVEILMAVFAQVGPTFSDYLEFAALAVLGNAVGGAGFVALLKFGHVQASANP